MSAQIKRKLPTSDPRNMVTFFLESQRLLLPWALSYHRHLTRHPGEHIRTLLSFRFLRLLFLLHGCVLFYPKEVS